MNAKLSVGFVMKNNPLLFYGRNLFQVGFMLRLNGKLWKTS